MSEFLSPDFVTFFLPLAGAVVAWFVNERRRRQWEEYKRKEEHYQELIGALKGFYADTPDVAARQAFLGQVNLCWLYCPDEVIRKVYDFLDAVRVGSTASPQERNDAAGAFVLAIRKDLLSRRIVSQTKLTSRDFLHAAAGAA